MKTLLLFGILSIILSCEVYSQKLLLFQKNWRREAMYKSGDVISFRLKGDKSKYTMQITGFDDSVIVFRNYRINPQEISHMYVDKKTKSWYILRYKYGKILPIAGAGFMLLDAANSGEVSESTMIIGTSLIITGVVLKLLISNKIKIRGRRKLAVL